MLRLVAIVYLLYIHFFKFNDEIITSNTPISLTTHHTVSNTELFQSDNCYTLFNDNTPRSEQSRTVLIRQTVHAQTRASSLSMNCVGLSIALRLFSRLSGTTPDWRAVAEVGEGYGWPSPS